ncbi:MAG: hexitol phosphatase HxpB [Actinobacteria bacterium]|nr:hexitol phosphatase HxpB [Actinomycetota bacterium]
MDGLLVDTEPLWQDAEIELFATVGLQLDRPACRETQGLRVDEAVEYWYRRQPWPDADLPHLAERIVDRVAELMRATATPLPGVESTLSLVRDRGMAVALASSSTWRMIESVLTHFDWTHRFDVIHSAEAERYGKPDPAIFLTTATRLGVEPRACVVFEDSVNGIVAAKAAGMACVAVPGHGVDVTGAGPDAIVETLEQVDGELLDRLLEPA